MIRKISLVLLCTVCAGGVFADGGREWPSKLKQEPARIVRLEYAGGNWDQNMGGGKDFNLLLWYQVVSGLKIAKESESIRAGELATMKESNIPAFLLVTGSKDIKLSDEEVLAIRDYCRERNGMLVISNGGGNFDANIRTALKRWFPGSELEDIPDDSSLYKWPFPMPNGAPSLWHHSGRRALGLKIGDRWGVFYHQGDLLDAWQDGHAGVNEALAIAAYKLGFNLIHYAYSPQEAKTKDEQPAVGD